MYLERNQRQAHSCVTHLNLRLTVSRAHSPGIAAPSFSGAQRFNVSFHTPSPRGHSILASPNSTLNETGLMPEMEPILPDLCIEQLWTETGATSRSAYVLCLQMLPSESARAVCDVIMNVVFGQGEGLSGV